MPGKLKELQTLFVLSLYPPVPCYVQEWWRLELPDGSLSGESSLADRISVVIFWTLMVSYSSIAASVNLVTTSSSDSYHDLVWYHDTTAVEASLNALYHPVHVKLSKSDELGEFHG